MATNLSLYADDVVLFCYPDERDLFVARDILGLFGTSSGLHTNLDKCTAMPIQCPPELRDSTSNHILCPIGEFPAKYLGLPLVVKSLTRADWQPMLDQVRHYFPAWQRGMIHHPGRLILVQSVISARPLHHLMVMDAPAWVFEEINSGCDCSFGQERIK